MHVKGYFRKNGTYVAPHYRTRANGIKSDNWSFKGNVNPYTGKVGTKDYPLGVWRSPSDEKVTYNTPFGFMADYDQADAKGLTVKDAPKTSSIKKGYRIRSYKIGGGAETPIASWQTVSSAAMESDAKTITLIGTTEKGKPMSVEVPISGPELWYGGEEDARPDIEGNGLIVGVNYSVRADGPCLIDEASKDSHLEAGMVIEGVREKSEDAYTPVKSWLDFKAFIAKRDKSADRELVIKGKTQEGSPFTMMITLK